MRLLAPIASARTAIICAPAILPGASAAMLFNRITLGSRIRADDNRGRYANYGFEMGVCRTWWKRVSYASEMHARLKALLERMAIDLNARLDPVSAIL
jgi:hypothetical protein